MDSTTQLGNYTALAGLAVLLLSKVGINASIDDVLTIMGALVVLAGIIKQAIDHRNLAQAFRAAQGRPDYIG